ncbi:hypothetical protein EDD85DRAFT_798815 [Armillaria nabsnona]|nr:hypothetical protein EDD85DRAFT_798815 [Armillaria nabsnona]
MSYQPDQPSGSPDPRFGDETVVINKGGKSSMQELWDKYNLSQLIEGAGSEPHPSTAYHIQYYREYELQASDVDPKNVFLDVLNGTDNVRLLNAAWKGLSRCLRRGHCFVVKYMNEFERRIRVLSPVSTIIGAYDDGTLDLEPEDRLLNALKTIPSHNRELSLTGSLRDVFEFGNQGSSDTDEYWLSRTEEEEGDKSTLRTPRNKGKERALEPDFDERDSEATVCRELLEDDELEYKDDELEYINYISGGSRESSLQNWSTHSVQPGSEPSGLTMPPLVSPPPPYPWDGTATPQISLTDLLSGFTSGRSSSSHSFTNLFRSGGSAMLPHEPPVNLPTSPNSEALKLRVLNYLSTLLQTLPLLQTLHPVCHQNQVLHPVNCQTWNEGKNPEEEGEEEEIQVREAKEVIGENKEEWDHEVEKVIEALLAHQEIPVLLVTETMEIDLLTTLLL